MKSSLKLRKLIVSNSFFFFHSVLKQELHPKVVKEESPVGHTQTALLSNVKRRRHGKVKSQQDKDCIKMSSLTLRKPERHHHGGEGEELSLLPAKTSHRILEVLQVVQVLDMGTIVVAVLGVAKEIVMYSTLLEGHLIGGKLGEVMTVMMARRVGRNQGCTCQKPKAKAVLTWTWRRRNRKVVKQGEWMSTPLNKG